MHRKIDTAGQQCFLDFFREQALAALFRQRAILNDVAGRPDDDESNPVLFHAHSRGQSSPYRARLDQGEGPAARPGGEGGCGWRFFPSRGWPPGGWAQRSGLVFFSPAVTSPDRAWE